MKYVSLFSLTVQNVLSILLLRYVRTTPGPRFINSTAVLNSEIQKAILSFVFYLYEQGSVRRGLRNIYDQVICEPKDTLKPGILAMLYILQNNLVFIAISNLDAAIYQVGFPLLLSRMSNTRTHSRVRSSALHV
jgi:solute carrier family 35 (UDP-sugar transporter), member A1/2/3